MVKIILYVVSFACLGIFGSLFLVHYSRVNAPVSAPVTRAEPATNTPAIDIDSNLTSVEVETNATASESPGRTPSKRIGSMMTYGALAFISLLGCGLLVAREMARFVGSRAESLMMSDDGEGLRSPEYEQAEAVWANGRFLEAIQLMRDYLKEHPRELHAALRIAEIYEKDLNNPLAAALEYEEVIKHKLPPERWGWTAIRLANLYSGKLNKSDQAIELLRKIITDYPQTAAAKKARERLASEQPAAGPAPAKTDQPDSNLPPGFSPKK